MQEISQRLKAAEQDMLDPSLRARILSSVSYAEPAGAPRTVPWHIRGVQSALVMSGATIAGLLVLVALRPLWLPRAEAPLSYGSISASKAPTGAIDRQEKVFAPSKPSPATSAPIARPAAPEPERKSITQPMVDEEDASHQVQIDNKTQKTVPENRSVLSGDKSESQSRAMLSIMKLNQQSEARKIYLNSVTPEESARKARGFAAGVAEPSARSSPQQSYKKAATKAVAAKSGKRRARHANAQTGNHAGKQTQASQSR